MQIYLFTICSNDEITIVQVYSTGRIAGKISIMNAYGCEYNDIKYQGEDTTTCPMNWDRFASMD